MLITDTGVLVRTRVAEIREMGRATQGVTLMNLDAGAKLSGLQRIAENDAVNDKTMLKAMTGGDAQADADTIPKQQCGRQPLRLRLKNK